MAPRQRSAETTASLHRPLDVSLGGQLAGGALCRGAEQLSVSVNEALSDERLSTNSAHKARVMPAAVLEHAVLCSRLAGNQLLAVLALLGE